MRNGDDFLTRIIIFVLILVVLNVLAQVLNLGIIIY